MELARGVTLQGTMAKSALWALFVATPYKTLTIELKTAVLSPYNLTEY